MKSSMNKTELKKIIKECVKEVIFEGGIVSDLVSEIAAGFVKANLLEGRGGQGSLSGVDSGDKGIDISGIPGMNNWKHLIK